MRSRRLVAPDERHEQHADHVADGVEDDRHRRGDGLDEEAGHGRSGDGRAGPRELELRIALDQLIAMDEAREV